MLYEEYRLDEGRGGRFEQPGRNGMLHRLQTDILGLVDGTSGEEPPLEIAAADRSLQVHSCHSPLREVEVLHDRLLDLFAAVPGLAPRDVIVMMPQIDDYAPFIAAIFGGVKDPARRIPYAVADRTLASGGSLVRAFLELFDIVDSRFEASRIMDLLENRFVAARFGLDDDGIATVRRWITESGIRWGIDAADRQDEGLPSFAENSWTEGLDRLLLGYAMPGDGASLFSGILPYSDIEGGEARNLGGVIAFAEALFALHRFQRKECTPTEWAGYLSRLLETFFLPDDEVQTEHLFLASSFDELRKKSTDAGFTGEITLAVVRTWLMERFAKTGVAEGFLTGRVTFCAMLPMRSIPFRVVALLGMNDGIFPRQHRPSGFDLMAAAPKRCDRSIRNEDRYLFLESLLSARDALYISYTGQSGKDNAVMPPSVVVSELLDYAERAFVVAGAPETRRRETVRERIVVKHRLQPFHKDYFTPTAKRLFSYSAENCAAAGSRQSGGGTTAILAGLPLALPDAEQRQLTIDHLAAFLGNPAATFLRRAGIRIEGVEPPVEDREPFAANGLDSYKLSAELVADYLAGRDPACKADSFMARGVLPPAGPGRAAFAAIRERSGHFAAAVAPFAALPSLEPIDIEWTISGVRLTGRITGINRDGLLRYRCARLKAKDLLNCWVHHLFLNLCAPEGYPRRSLFIASDGHREFAPCANAGKHLATLVDLYQKGLCEPLPFFPETSCEFAANPDKSEKLLSIWNGYQSGKLRHKGERERERSFDLFFGSLAPEELFASPDFRDIAQAVYLPLHDSLVKEDR
jgi:exodeoxyribonuclease V gamma subunit